MASLVTLRPQRVQMSGRPWNSARWTCNINFRSHPILKIRCTFFHKFEHSHTDFRQCAAGDTADSEARTLELIPEDLPQRRDLRPASAHAGAPHLQKRAADHKMKNLEDASGRLD